ncbi:hypothetical protein FMM80_07850 [Schaedlerella arabinosiphila]|uniref:Uncharacterized protein n=1 Tax=Schaedlerella arabinosiphila TaxID=2044587 RepID=A0A9X5C5V1_9FIRM|nr:hypothetical protein [Schaedlerella arabinosiphila]
MSEMEVDDLITITLTNEILKRISEIDENRFSLSTIDLPPVTKNRLKKNSKKKSEDITRRLVEKYIPIILSRNERNN